MDYHKKYYLLLGDWFNMYIGKVQNNRWWICHVTIARPLFQFSFSVIIACLMLNQMDSTYPSNSPSEIERFGFRRANSKESGSPFLVTPPFWNHQMANALREVTHNSSNGIISPMQRSDVSRAMWVILKKNQVSGLIYFSIARKITDSKFVCFVVFVIAFAFSEWIFLHLSVSIQPRHSWLWSLDQLRRNSTEWQHRLYLTMTCLPLNFV